MAKSDSGMHSMPVFWTLGLLHEQEEEEPLLLL